MAGLTSPRRVISLHMEIITGISPTNEQKCEKTEPRISNRLNLHFLEFREFFLFFSDQLLERIVLIM